MKNRCEICGREVHSLIRFCGYKTCTKHYNQYKKYGRFLDNNPRTQKDYNEFIDLGDGTTKYFLYGVLGNPTADGLVDTEDVHRLQYIKWSLTHGYCGNRNRGKKAILMHRFVMNTDQFVDHINHNKLDNRKCNLRIVTKSQNQMNSNYKGVNERKDGRYMAHIKKNGLMVNLGVYEDKEVAYWVRWYAERIVFREYAYPKEEPFITEDRKKELKVVVEKKVQRLDISV